MTHIGILFDLPFLLITFYLIVKYKVRIANWFLKLPLPNFLVALISSLPFIIVEENINCEAFACQYTIWPFTVIPLLIYIAIIGVLYRKFKPKNMKKFISIFCTIGVIFELTFGASNVEFKQLPFVWFVIIAGIVFLSYAYLMIIPLEILKRGKNISKKK